MAKSKYNFYADPGHGWLKVKRSELVKLGIADKISCYSYQRNDDVYLEEDCDFSKFEQAKQARGETITVNFQLAREKSSKIRSYYSYRA